MKIINYFFLLLITNQLAASFLNYSSERNLVGLKDLNSDDLLKEIDSLVKFDDVYFLNVASGGVVIARTEEANNSEGDNVQNVLFGMRDKDHSYIENFYHGKED